MPEAWQLDVASLSLSGNQGFIHNLDVPFQGNSLLRHNVEAIGTLIPTSPC